jgi:MarR family 2-MHQ and catechol resistance regulon transcriptional repressor
LGYLRSKMSEHTAVTHRAEDASADQASALKLLVVLSRAHNAVQAHLHANVGEHGLTLAEFAILEVLYHKGPLLLGEVQRRILVSSGGVTYLVDRLEQKGLVERRDCPQDRRARYAALTADGEELIGRIFPEHAQCIERVMGGLTPEEQREATRLLRQLGRSAAALDGCRLKE